MPATRSAGARPRQNLRDNVDPCEICGIVISRKGDMSRHAKTHATNDADKLPCPLEGCGFRTLQKSNLETHMNRHKKEKPYRCNDSGCDFRTCDPASLLRHRKQLHGYIPRSAVGYKTKKPYKHVPASVMRGIDLDSSGSARISSQFYTFSCTEAYTSAAPAPASSSRQLHLPQSPRAFPSPTPTPTTFPLESFPPSRSYLPSSSSVSHPRRHSRANVRLHSTNFFGESQVPTPIASTSHHEFTPEGPSSTTGVLSSNPYPVYAESQLYHPTPIRSLHNSLLFAPPTQEYTWPVDPSPLAAEPWNGSMVPAPSRELEILEYQHPEEVVYDTRTIVSREPQALELNIRPPSLSPDHDADRSWPGINTTGLLIGTDGLPIPLDTQQFEAPPSSSALPYPTQVVEQHPIYAGPSNPTHHHYMPVGEFQRNEYNYPTHYQPSSYSSPSPLRVAMAPNPLDHFYSSQSNYYPPPLPSPHEMYPNSHDVGATNLGYYDTTQMSLNGGNSLNVNHWQNYHHGFNTGASPQAHASGSTNPFVSQDDTQYHDMDLKLAWN